jgi:riboflavin synthase
MFTGIITDLGTVRAVDKNGDTRFDFSTGYDTEDIAIGASIACSGVCLTVIDKGPGWFAVQASAETLACTTLGEWRPGSPVNLERALSAGDEMGGHIVAGHVDGVARILDRFPEGDSFRFVFEAPKELQKFIAPKGSVSLDGVSMTVNEVDGPRFGVNVIPHTQSMTTFGVARPGDRMNLEVDMLARYVERLLECRSSG